MPENGDNVGRMTVELTHNGTSRPLLAVSFDPVGMFTPGLLGDNLQMLAQEIERAQVRERHRATTEASTQRVTRNRDAIFGRSKVGGKER
jgi:hypothetical protein